MARLPGGSGFRSGPDRTVNQQETEFLRRGLEESKYVTATGSTTRRTIADHFGEVANVCDYGAKGDGSHDDTDAFKTAAATGKPILVPATTSFYKVTAKIGIANSVIGQGMPEIRMVGATGFDPTVIFEVSGYHGTHLFIGGLHLNGGWDNSGTAGEWGHIISVRGSDNLTIEDCVIEYAYGDGVYVAALLADPTDNSEHIRVRNCRIEHCRRCCVAVVGGVGVWIEDNQLQKDNGYVSVIDLETNAHEIVSDVHITRNRVTAPGTLFVGLGQSTSNHNPKRNVWIESNQVLDATGFVYKPVQETGWENLFFRGNLYLGSTVTTDYPSMFRLRVIDTTGGDFCNNVEICDNFDFSGAGAGAGYGWEFVGCKNILVRGNQILPTGGRPFGIDTRGLSNAIFTDNSIQGMSSGGSAIMFQTQAGIATANIKISHNTFGGAGGRLLFGDPITNITIAGNQFVGTPPQHLRNATTLTGLTLYGNQFPAGATIWGGAGTYDATSHVFGNVGSADIFADIQINGDVGIRQAPSTYNRLTLLNEDNTKKSISVEQTNDGTPDLTLQIMRARGTHAIPTTVAGSDVLGAIGFRGFEGTNWAQAAMIRVRVDGTPGTNDMPGRIEFHVSPDGSATVAEAMRISSTKLVQLQSLTALQRVETDVSKQLVSKANAAAQANSTAVDVPGLVADFNALLAKLRTAGLMAP